MRGEDLACRIAREVSARQDVAKGDEEGRSASREEWANERWGTYANNAGKGWETETLRATIGYERYCLLVQQLVQVVAEDMCEAGSNGRGGRGRESPGTSDGDGGRGAWDTHP